MIDWRLGTWEDGDRVEFARDSGPRSYLDVTSSVATQAPGFSHGVSGAPKC